MFAKLILKELWKAEVDWDAEVPSDLKETWQSFCSSIKELENFKIPRNINPGNTFQVMTIHGFADASEAGFGACVYALSHDRENRPQVNLLCSKSRVAPSKGKLTVPRLELNAARLLAKLVSVVRKALGDKVKDVHYWSDSTITLYWIDTPPDNLQTFVANRVAAIQKLTHGFGWHHVPSGDNPADILSRGSLTEQLLNTDLW